MLGIFAFYLGIQMFLTMLGFSFTKFFFSIRNNFDIFRDSFTDIGYF